MPSIFRKSIAAGIGFLILATTGLGTTASSQAAPSSDLAVLLRPSPDAPQRRDHRGERPTVEALHDRLVVVSFVSVDCTIVCAVRTLELDKLARSLPEPLRGRVRFLAIDTDPARDDAARLRAFADGLVGPTTPVRFLDSDAASTAAIAARLRYPASALPEPPQTVLVFDRRGQIAMSYGSDPLDAPRLLRDLTVLETFEDGVGQPPRGAVAPASTF